MKMVRPILYVQYNIFVLVRTRVHNGMQCLLEELFLFVYFYLYILIICLVFDLFVILIYVLFLLICCFYLFKLEGF